MAHKTLIGGTAYEIGGGKTLVNGTAYSIDKGKTLVGGTAYEVGFVSWPEDLNTGLEFVSANPFTIKARWGAKWDGTMEYCNGKEWLTWDGSEISSGASENGQCIYIRGTGNTKVSGDSSGAWGVSGSAVECNGNIEKLLDYATVAAGGHPTMANSCYAHLFYDCQVLTSAPSLPATTLSESCYSSMFSGCSSLKSAPSLPATTLAYMCYYGMFMYCYELTTVPKLPATTLAGWCYFSMFGYCTKIKVSETKTGDYTREYRIPYSGTGITATSALSGMFKVTGGTFKGDATINTTYYLDKSNTIV